MCLYSRFRCLGRQEWTAWAVFLQMPHHVSPELLQIVLEVFAQRPPRLWRFVLVGGGKIISERIDWEKLAKVLDMLRNEIIAKMATTK